VLERTYTVSADLPDTSPLDDSVTLETRVLKARRHTLR
jgi:hypothetical protein